MEINITKTLTETADVSTSEVVRVTAELIRDRIGIGTKHYLDSGYIVYDEYTGVHTNDIESRTLRTASAVDIAAFTALQVIYDLI